MTQSEQKTINQVQTKQAIMEKNQEDMANLLGKQNEKLDKLDAKIDDLNTKFDELTGAKKALIWVTGVLIGVASVILGYIKLGGK